MDTIIRLLQSHSNEHNAKPLGIKLCNWTAAETSGLGAICLFVTQREEDKNSSSGKMKNNFSWILFCATHNSAHWQNKQCYYCNFNWLYPLLRCDAMQCCMFNCKFNQYRSKNSSRRWTRKMNSETITIIIIRNCLKIWRSRPIILKTYFSQIDVWGVPIWKMQKKK